MKLAFSNTACPELDLDGLLARASAWGYGGVELKCFEGRLDLTSAPTLQRDPTGVGRRFQDAGLTLVALNSSLSFCDREPEKLARNRDKARAYVELAGRMGAKLVVVCGDVLPAGASKARYIEQTAAVLRELAPEAAERGVTIVIENIGDFASSRDMWLVHDAVRFPSVRVCWNQLYALMLRERPSLSIPRLGHALGLIHVSDARLGADGLIEAYAPIGQGHVEIERMLELLKGVAYDGWVCVEWPRLWQPGLAPAEQVLPAYGQFLKGIIERKPVVLSAYKGDKNAPRFTARRPRSAPA